MNAFDDDLFQRCDQITFGMDIVPKWGLLSLLEMQRQVTRVA